jgi:hypothetical protein
MNLRRAALVLFALSACNRTPTPIGTPCKGDGDCTLAGQRCAFDVHGLARICTHACSAQAGELGCPYGYDCRITDPALGAMCAAQPYVTDPDTHKPVLFGRDCALDASVCASTGDPNPAPICRSAPNTYKRPLVPIESDPNAYCSGACTVDGDCPVDLACVTDYDGAQRCVRRSLCSACVIDLDCPADFPACVPTSDGSSRYCTRPCQTNNDCVSAQSTFLRCADSTDAAGNGGLFCLHAYGACVGHGAICDPCRSDADCDPSLFCITNGGTHESWCTKRCQEGHDEDCPSPNPTGCNYTVGGHVCTGGNTMSFPTTFTCWEPM